MKVVVLMSILGIVISKRSYDYDYESPHLSRRTSRLPFHPLSAGIETDEDAILINEHNGNKVLPNNNPTPRRPRPDGKYFPGRHGFPGIVVYGGGNTGTRIYPSPGQFGNPGGYGGGYGSGNSGAGIYPSPGQFGNPGSLGGGYISGNPGIGVYPSPGQLGNHGGYGRGYSGVHPGTGIYSSPGQFGNPGSLGGGYGGPRMFLRAHPVDTSGPYVILSNGHLGVRHEVFPAGDNSYYRNSYNPHAYPGHGTQDYYP